MFNIIFGIVLIAYGVFRICKIFFKNRKCTEEAVATVTGVESTSYTTGRRHRKRKHKYHPVVEFTVNGQKVQQRAPLSSSSSDAYEVGSEIEILYNPQDPQEFRALGKSPWSEYLLALLALLLGAGYLWLVLK